MTNKKENKDLKREDTELLADAADNTAAEKDAFSFIEGKLQADVTVSPDENPFASGGITPADIMRIFYNNDIPIIPVVSKRGLLFGILKKDDVISELSDISRSERYSIDEFITKLAKKMSLEDLLPYGTIREFPVINIFGELSSNWTRVQLFAAAEKPSASEADGEVRAQKEEQVMDWFIYLILEHIPRPLYALNAKGKTMFYNGHFEQFYLDKMKSDVDIVFVETTINDSEKNDFLSDYKAEVCFYNKDFDCNYEKVPLLSKKQKVGYLLYFDDNQSGESGLTLTYAEIDNMQLDDILAFVERQVIVRSLRDGKEIKNAAEALKVSRQSLLNRMKKLGISR